MLLAEVGCYIKGCPAPLICPDSRLKGHRHTPTAALTTHSNVVSVVIRLTNN